MAKPLGITDVVLRDGHQSLLATRLRLEDMLPICGKLDQVGYWSLETWGGATFDACIRYLGEDPWERLRAFKKAMPNTQQQMLLRGQNLLGYRHYADDVLDAFVERAASNGIDVFRIFDALNDPRNMQHAIKSVVSVGKHAQGTLSYTVSPVHTMDMWIDLARELEDFGAHSVCIKDMAGLLRPYVAEELVSRLKAILSIPIHMQCHATTGLSTTAIVKAVEAGIDNVDTSISSMSMTYGHSPTETIAAIFEGTERDTGLNIELLAEIAAYFRDIRKKYAQFEGSLRGIDSRILIAQVPGGMLTNMESQLREQGAQSRMDEVLEEIPHVRKDLGFIPLVTPTSQIVGTQAVINVMSGERYKTITKESAGVLKGNYGKTPAPVNQKLQERVLEGASPITCRPADLINPEIDTITDEVTDKAAQDNVALADNVVEDALIYAMFGQVGWKFISNRNNPDAFEPAPDASSSTVKPVNAVATQVEAVESYSVVVNGTAYHVEVGPSETINQVHPATSENTASSEKAVEAPMAGNILKITVNPGQIIQEGDVVVIMEAMKMETEVRARFGGILGNILVKEGDTVAVGDALLTLA
ncbi:MAG: sodium-extruding oxaloacetate decarboxylase subunit alpha [Methylococcales bacterium]